VQELHRDDTDSVLCGGEFGAELARVNPVRRLPLFFVLVVVAAVAAAMRRSVPLPDCVITIDPGVQLNLERPADRQHLSAELAQIDAIASRFRERIRADPPVTATAHALRTHATRPDRAYRYCQAILREQLAKAHGLATADLP
jgi:hypothetical protein